MIYFDVTSLEAFTGFNESVFKDAGTTMGATAWNLLVSQLDQSIAGWMHRWCGVPTFGPHYVEEYHNGRGENGTEDTYCETDRQFFLREVPTSDPVVYQDTASETDAASWVQRTMRTTATGGDYYYTSQRGFGIVRFHSNVPGEGYNNVKITYWAGFPEGSDDLENIRFIAKRLATNLLLVKKKIQESTTIRNVGVRDYSQMFDLELDRKVFTPELELMLSRYRRYQFDTGGFE